MFTRGAKWIDYAMLSCWDIEFPEHRRTQPLDFLARLMISTNIYGQYAHTHTASWLFKAMCYYFFCLHIDELSQGLLFCDDGHHIKSSRKAWICSNAAWGRGRHTDTPLPEILDDVWGVRYHLCTGATVDIWWYLEFGMSLSDFFLSENHGRIFLALINLWFSSQRPEPQWISARNDDAVDMTSPMIGRSLDEHFTKSVSLWCRKSIAFQWISWTNKNNSRCLFSEADPFLVTWDRPTPGASQERQRGSGGPNWNCPFLGMDHDGSPSKAWCWVT